MSPTRTLGIVLALASLAQPARACLTGDYQQYILMEKVSPAAEGSSVIAKVEILGVEKADRWFSVGHGRVLTPIKGVEFGQVIAIFAQETSCGGGLDQWDVGRQGFVAGEIDASSGLFKGTWSEARLRRLAAGSRNVNRDTSTAQRLALLALALFILVPVGAFLAVARAVKDFREEVAKARARVGGAAEPPG